MDAGLKVMKMDKEELGMKPESEDACEVCDKVTTSGCDTDRQPIDTIEDAISFLQWECSYVVVPLEMQPTNWKVVSLNGEFEELITGDDVIKFAGDERDRVHVPYAQVSDESDGQFSPSGGAL